MRMDKACAKRGVHSRYSSQKAPPVYIHGFRPSLSYQSLSIVMAIQNPSFGTVTEIQHQIQSNVSVLFQYTRGSFRNQTGVHYHHTEKYYSVWMALCCCGKLRRQQNLHTRAGKSSKISLVWKYPDIRVFKLVQIADSS